MLIWEVWQSRSAGNFTEGYKKGQEKSSSPKAGFPDGYQGDSPKFLFRWSLDLTVLTFPKAKFLARLIFSCSADAELLCSKVRGRQIQQTLVPRESPSWAAVATCRGLPPLRRYWARMTNQHTVPAQTLAGHSRETRVPISNHKLHPREYDQRKQPMPDAPCPDQHWSSSVGHTDRSFSHHSHWALSYKQDF